MRAPDALAYYYPGIPLERFLEQFASPITPATEPFWYQTKPSMFYRFFVFFLADG